MGKKKPPCVKLLFDSRDQKSGNLLYGARSLKPPLFRFVAKFPIL